MTTTTFKTLKNIWKGINDIVTLKNKEKHQTISLEINKKVETDPKTVSEEFNNEFNHEILFGKAKTLRI